MISSFTRQLYQFLKDWFSDSPTIRIHTSGSTGAPKEITARKTQMIESARMTCGFLGLKENDKALLCLPLEYIAGKMVVVRALYAGLDLYPVEPCGHPLADTDIVFDFAAMIPLQVYNSLQIPEERKKLSEIKHLIIGGGAMDEAMEKELADFPNAIYSTYGMTETLSHIALRRLNGINASPYYTPLPTVKLSLSEENTLVIDAPLVSDEPLITNDIAELRTDGSFRILGRKDNVINTGGIKVQIEEVEQLLKPHIVSLFAITSVPHPKLGEAIVLLVESDIEKESIKNAIRQLLSRHKQPLGIFQVARIPQTGNGKPDRIRIKKLAEQICPASTLTHI
ncbi:MAG: AMP-binding protein [Massilibacteroides sp.]|nr:AMP-binding protein [Massilibacteroides sp.]MDD4514605.1 AMP-binding protein [Massilibacteroides sp.]